MDKLRSVNTKFWQDPFIEDLNPTEKLLFLYLLTNPLGNILGIYEISVKRISYDTGIGKETIKKAFESFESVGKVFYFKDYVIMANFLKNQKLNSNMWVGAKKIFGNLPKLVIVFILNKTLEGFESLSKDFEHFRKYESEIEIEKEIESEGECSKEQPPKINYYKYFNHLKITIEEKDKLIEQGYSISKIDEILESIQNYAKNTNYKNLYLTAKKWLKKDSETKTNNTNINKNRISHDQDEFGNGTGW